MTSFIDHVRKQREFSLRTFGPPQRTQEARMAGPIGHIRKELEELEKEPFKLDEWMDVIILAMDGAWRSGHTPEEIGRALLAKQEKNERRKWPDWTTMTPGTPIEHVRGVED